MYCIILKYSIQFKLNFIALVKKKTHDKYVKNKQKNAMVTYNSFNVHVQQQTK